MFGIEDTSYCGMLECCCGVSGGKYLLLQKASDAFMDAAPFSIPLKARRTTGVRCEDVVVPMWVLDWMKIESGTKCNVIYYEGTFQNTSAKLNLFILGLIKLLS